MKSGVLSAEEENRGVAYNGRTLSASPLLTLQIALYRGRTGDQLKTFALAPETVLACADDSSR